MFKLSISNIAWTAENDQDIYSTMKRMGFMGLEIAPTRIFPVNPYANIDAAKAWSKSLLDEYGFLVPSIQSIWYGRAESIFGTEGEREAIINYTKQAIDFAEAIGCKNLVFGCPRNRVIAEDVDDAIPVYFFKTIGDYAYSHNTVIGMEANPSIYNTNYVNTTSEALDLIARVDSYGFKLNLDIGTMIYNNEDISILRDSVGLINHVHISEPGLKAIQKRNIHKELKTLLLEKYGNYISIEMGRDASIEIVKQSMNYISGLFL